MAPVIKPTLLLHDVAPYVHTGMSVESDSKHQVKGFPVGGLKRFFRHFVYSMASMSESACFFDSSTNRRTILPEYKANRIGRGDPSSDAQIQFLYEILPTLGIPCYKETGFEADDLIYSAVEENYDCRNSIYVYSADRDLMHNVDYKVFFEPVNTNVNRINASNFSKGVVKGETILFNTITAYKVFCGDDSDNIGPLEVSGSRKAKALYYDYCEFLKVNVPSMNPRILKDSRALEIYLSKGNHGLTPFEIEQVKKRIEVFFPRRYSGPTKFEGVTFDKVDLKSLAKILKILWELPSIKLIGQKEPDITDADLEVFSKWGRDLATGAFAAGKGLPIVDSKVFSEPISLRSFS